MPRSLSWDSGTIVYSNLVLWREMTAAETQSSLSNLFDGCLQPIIMRFGVLA